MLLPADLTSDILPPSSFEVDRTILLSGVAATTVDALVRVDVLEALDGEEAREVVASEDATMAVSMYEGKKNASLTS